MPFKINISTVPADKRNAPDFQELYKGAQEIFSEIIAINSFCIHEAGHVIYYLRAGVPIHSIVGPRMTYKEKPIFIPAAIQVELKDMEALGTSKEAVQKVAKIHAAGKASVLALTGLTAAGEETDRTNFNDFCDLAGIPKNDRNGIWDDAEYQIKKEIIKPANKKEAWDNAYNIRRLLFDIQPPANAGVGHPLRIVGL